MKKFTVTIEEMVSQGFEIEADTTEEAMAIAEEKYKSGELVLEPGELVAKQMAITSLGNEATEWAEF